MNFENIIYEEKGAAAIITINRPKALNALYFLPVIWLV